ncbi:neo-calmodulin-like [Lineus longissimus]|uniref:neo-calmodulin-like n=1 Tax=Lineus longissimus TaxID=88925 RepID=UPI002B4CF7C7
MIMEEELFDYDDDSMAPEKMAIYKEAFELFDKDGNGNITTGDLGTVLRTLGWKPTESELDQIVLEVDADASGTIDFIEFLTVVKTTPLNENEDIELRGALSCFDYNSDGLISAAEIRHMMTSTGEKVTDEDVDKMLADCQIDGDGMISYESLVKKMVLNEGDTLFT